MDGGEAQEASFVLLSAEKGRHREREGCGEKNGTHEVGTRKR